MYEGHEHFILTYIHILYVKDSDKYNVFTEIRKETSRRQI